MNLVQDNIQSLKQLLLNSVSDVEIYKEPHLDQPFNFDI